jgi:O-antigen ligase
MGMIRYGLGQIQQLRKAKLPFFPLWVGAATVVACFGGDTGMGFRVSGLAWILIILLSLFVVIRQIRYIALPIIIWLPWMFLVVLWGILWPSPNSLQRSVMLLCPVLAGLAASSFPLRAERIAGLPLLLRFITVALWIIVIANTGLLVTGRLPETTGLAGQSITATLLCCYFAVEYAAGKPGALKWWGAVAFIPVFALTRMAVLAAGVTLPLTFARLKFSKRVLYMSLMILLGVMIFFTPRMQSKMFHSGRGSISDLRLDNPDFQTSGRVGLWEEMEYEIKKEPWLGHGANASEELVQDLTGGLAHPHNDWLRLRYDYGLLGTGVFIFCMVVQCAHLLLRARRAKGDARILLFAGASSFLPFALMMYTDNIILYASFFGNLQFTLIGMGYSALKGSQLARKRIARVRMIPSRRFGRAATLPFES